MITDARQRILKVNQAFTRITGYRADEAIGRQPSMLRSDKHDSHFYQAIWATLSRRQCWRGEVWNRHRDGTVYPQRLSITPVLDEHGEVTHYIGSFSDLSERKRAEEAIHKLAFYDTLTKLPNRRLLMDRLTHALQACSRQKTHGALLVLDLDHFKDLNDTRGHEIGDQLLIAVGKRLHECVRASDTTARIGGDEFVIVLENLSTNADDAVIEAELAAEKIRAALNRPFELTGIPYTGSPSIGITLFQDLDLDADELLKRGDAAMYQAKQSGRNCVCFYDLASHLALAERIALLDDLRSALALRQFELHYQMQVNQHGEVCGAEALLRWLHPERGMVSPAQFIPLAEQTGAILEIGNWVLRSVCEQLKRWEQDPVMRQVQVSVNVSALQFRQTGFVELVRDVVRGTGISASQLKLELTESLVLEDIDDAIFKIESLKKNGLTFSMDDFGTGQSSLTYLTRLPLDQLKIDQSFVRNIGVRPSDGVIIKTVIGLAHNLGMEVIAEGVETHAQHEFLEQQGCLLHQGYLFARPLALGPFEQCCRRHQQAKAMAA